MSNEIKPGVTVEVRDVVGEWHRTVARSVPFLNVGYQLHRRDRPWMVVAVDHAGYDEPVNWPAEDVRALPDNTEE